MTIGTVNIGSGSSLPLNVRFQIEEPVDKNGIWVKREFDKYPDIVIGSFNPTPFGFKAYSFANLTLQMASIETDNYHVFYTKGRQQQNYSGDRLIAINKTDKSVTQTTFFFNDATTPISIGDDVYFPFPSYIRKLNVLTMEYTQIPVPNTATNSGRTLYQEGNILHLFANYPAFYPGWYKIDINNNYQVTEMPRLATTSMPGNPQLNKDGYFPFFDGRNGNLFTYFNSANGELTATPFKIGVSGTMLHYDKDKKYILFTTNGANSRYHAFNTETGVLVDLGISLVSDAKKVRESNSKTKNLTYHSSYGSSYNPKINIHEYDILDTIESTMLIIDTTDLGGYGTKLMPLDGASANYEIKVADAKLLVDEKLVEDVIFIGDGKEFIKLERLEVRADG